MNVPLFLTCSRVVFAIAVAAFLLAQGIVPFSVTIAAMLFSIAAVTDFFDGRLARSWNQTTEVGAFLDPLADKLLVYLAFIYLTVVNAYPAWLLLVVFTRDIVTDTFRAYCVGKGCSMPANMVSKWKSFFQMLSLALFLILLSMNEVLANMEWGRIFLLSVVSSSSFDVAVDTAYWLMVVAAAVGWVGTVQYFIQFGPKILNTTNVRC